MTEPLDIRKVCAQAAVVTLTLLAVVVVAAALWFGRGVFLLIFAGVLLCIVLRAITDFLHRRLHLPVPAALTATVLGLLGLAVAVALLIAPHVEDQVQQMWQSLPQTEEQARAMLQQHEWGQRLLRQMPSASDLSSHAAVVVRRSVQTVSGALGVIGNIVIIAFVGLYLAIDPERYRRGLVKLVPPPYRNRLWETLGESGDQLQRWLMGKLALMAFVGVTTAIGLFFLHVPLLFPLALLAALLDFIPNIGPVASAVPAVLLALTVGPAHALWTAGLYLAVQVVESYILSPLVEGNAVSMPPALLISSQVLLAVLLGLPGVLLATPLTVVGLVFLRKLYVGELLDGGAA